MTDKQLPTTTTQTLPAISFEQMEKMAVTCVASKLFGVKSKEEALALMLLANSEGIHPMTAVRDYHIISGRPSIKADTMLSRFMEAGGRVEWHELNDKKADATFSHPQGGSFRCVWTIEMAQKAKLAGKDVWQGYARAMLRSRCVSEGVRTVLPSVIVGKYTPEEIVSMDGDVIQGTAETVIADAGSHQLKADADENIRAIAEAADLAALKTAYQKAFNEAKDKKDGARIGQYTLAYEARKTELSVPAEPPKPIEGELMPRDGAESRAGDVI